VLDAILCNICILTFNQGRNPENIWC